MLLNLRWGLYSSQPLVKQEKVKNDLSIGYQNFIISSEIQSKMDIISCYSWLNSTALKLTKTKLHKYI